MIDFHCHLDLYKNPLSVFTEVKKRKTKVLAVTTSPRAYLKTLYFFQEAENVHVALGLHPELVAERNKEIELFMKEMSNCSYLGEIGIDGTVRNRDSYNIQKVFFSDVLYEAERNKGKIISIHSRGAVKDVLLSIEKTLSVNVPILHWFTGTSKELQWALSLGCWFSINPKMCYTKAGRNIINQIPLERMIPETDAPFTEKNGYPYMPWDTEVIKYLAECYGVSLIEIDRIMEQNLKEIHKIIKFRRY